MITRADYEKEKSAIEAIDIKDILVPNMPINIFIDEALDLHECGNRDKNLLTAEGLIDEAINSIPTRANALRYLQSVWMKNYDSTNKNMAEWVQMRDEGKELKSIIMHAFRFAYRNNSDVIKKIRRIDEGSSNADTVQDLHDLGILGKEYPEELSQTSFDITNLDRAIDLSVKMGKALAKSNDDSAEDVNHKVLRDKAYTHLKTVVEEIRTVGKYVFWRNPDKLDDYSSEYFMKRNRK